MKNESLPEKEIKQDIDIFDDPDSQDDNIDYEEEISDTEYKPDINQMSTIDEEDVEEEEEEEEQDTEDINPEPKKKKRYPIIYEPAQCDLCDKTYTRMEKLRIHKSNVHNVHHMECQNCQAHFNTKRDLNAHIKSEHNESVSKNVSDYHRRYNCNYCAMSFSFEGKLKRHLLSHLESKSGEDSTNDGMESGSRLYDCNFCDKSFSRISIRDQHMEDCHEDSFPCEHCDPVEHFSTRADLKSHEVILHNFKCPRCERTYKSEKIMKQHLRTHDKHINNCPYCVLTFPTKALLKEHRQKVHHKSHRCPCCHEIFDRNDVLNDHVVAVHEKVTCFYCQAEFPTLKGLKLHEMMHKDAEEEEAGPSGADNKNSIDNQAMIMKLPFPCTSCEASYNSQKKLENHIADKHDERGYNCDQCPKVFESKSKLRQHSYKHKLKLCGICGVYISTSLNTHMRRHENDKPFKCLVEGCGKQFPRNSDLMCHTKTHTGDKPFACDVCGMRFSRKNKVTVHMRTHTGEKPYKCTFPDCQREFAQSFDLTLHLRRHTGEKPYECDKCGERFILTTIMKNHKVNCRGTGIVKMEVDQ